MNRVLRWIYVAIVVIHGLIHLTGVAQGFGLAEMQELGDSVGTAGAVLWLIAAIGVLGAAFAAARQSSQWWFLTAVAALVSQTAVVTSWDGAKAGTIANVLMLAAAVYGYATTRPPHKEPARVG